MLKQEKERGSQYRDLTFNDVQGALTRVASQLEGYEVEAKCSDSALEYCHRLGLIHTELQDDTDLGDDIGLEEEKRQIRYTFASRIHQRYGPYLIAKLV